MDNKICLKCSDHGLARREFIKVGSLSVSRNELASLPAPSACDGQPEEAPLQQKAQSCILFFLEGGASQIDTWDPKPHSAFKAISTNVPGI